MTPEELATIEERYAVWKRGAMAGIDPEGYERWSEARSQLYYFDVPALIAAVRAAQEQQQAETMAILREIAEGEPLAFHREDYNYCIYCAADDSCYAIPLVHRDDCLWLRAKRLVEGA